MNRRGGTGKIIDLVHFYIEGMSNIMTKKLKVLVVQQVMDISSVSCEKIIHTEYFISLIEESVTKMAAQKATATTN
jgi:hypothetical protein